MGGLDVEAHVSPYYGPEVPGTARVRAPHARGKVHVEWKNERGEVLGHTEGIDRLECGVYSATVRDASRAEGNARVEVRRADLPVVVAYVVHDASHETAWDGHVRAVVHCVDEHLHRFAWSNGATTSSPELCDARPGVYSVAVIDDATGVAVPHVHACASAHVRFR